MSPKFARRLSSTISLLTSVLAASCGGPAEANNDDDTSNLAPVAQPTPADSGATAVPAPVPTMSTQPPPVLGEQQGDGAILGTEDQDPITPAELNADTACAGVELIPEQVEVQVPMEIVTTMEVLQPVALYIVLDNSLSMNDRLPGFENNDDRGGGGGNFTPPGMDDGADDGAGMPQLQELTPDAGAPDPAPTDPAPTGTPTFDGEEPTTRWELAVASLKAFVTSPESEGVDVAIQYFNPTGNGGGQDLCDGSFHGTPDVQMGRIPDVSQQIVDSLDDADPTGYTPTVGALTGGIDYCKQFQTDHPDEKCVVVLVTDGLPRSCGLCEDLSVGTDCYDPMSMDVLLPIAEAGSAAGVGTFTVVMDGVPAEGFELMDAIAKAGGTDCTPPDVGAEACNVSSSGSQGLVEALMSIRDTVTVTMTETVTEIVTETKTLDCQWLVPEAEEGEKLDPDRVNVQLSLDGVPGLIESVPTEADCATNGGNGWYYDNPTAPTMIYACPESCNQIQTGVNPSVQILLGCARVGAGQR